MGKTTVRVMVEGGKATPAPPLGPALSQAKVNVGQVIAQINEKTKAFSGMQVPVEVIIDTADKSFEIRVGKPPVAAIIKKELKLEKFAKAAWKEQPPGNISMEKIVEIAKSKQSALGTTNLKAGVKQIIGACLSYGITVENKNPKDILKEIAEGKWDGRIK